MKIPQLPEKLELPLLATVGLVGGFCRYYVKPELTAKRTWLAIGALVVAHEILCPPGELLSEGYDRALEKHRLTTTLPTLIVAGHLLNAFGKYDPLHQIVEMARPKSA